MEEGYHHVNDMTKVVAQNLPKAKIVYTRDLAFTEKAAGWFEPMHMACVRCSLYQLRD